MGVGDEDGWLRRLRSTGKVAASAARLAGRRALGVTPGAGDAALGEALARELDQMKGVAMKVGQILSYFDGVLPEAATERLRKLQTGAEPMPFATVRAQVAQAFGAELETLFERFDERPVAAASIGQVHRARFDGVEVAVKVQYPGVAKTMVADVSRLRGLSRVASLATQVDGPALADELAARFAAECDYAREGRDQAAFRAAFASEPWLEIPQVFPARTRGTVLTTRFSEAGGFYDFAAGASPEMRDLAGLRLARFTLRSIFSAGVVNADPHPGNALFWPDARLVVLDFGCVRRFSPAFLEGQRRLVQVVLDGRRSDFDAALLDAGLVGEKRGFDFEHHWRLLRGEWAPYLAPTHRFDADALRALYLEGKRNNPNLRRIAIPPEWIWLQRLTFGLHAVLARLGAKGDFGAELRDALARRIDVQNE